MNKFKQKTIIIFCCVLTVLIICIIISGSISNIIMPKVQTEQPLINTGLSISQQFTAFAQSKEENSVYALSGINITKVLVQSGDTVKAGDSLFEVDLLQVQANLTSLRASIIEQQTYINSYAWDEAKLNILNTKLQATRLEYNALAATIPLNGIITSQLDGVISYTANVGYAASGSVLYTVQSDTQTTKNILLQIEPQNIKVFCADNAEISVQYVAQAQNGYTDVTAPCSILSCTYNAGQNCFDIIAQINNTENLPFYG